MVALVKTLLLLTVDLDKPGYTVFLLRSGKPQICTFATLLRKKNWTTKLDLKRKNVVMFLTKYRNYSNSHLLGKNI